MSDDQALFEKGYSIRREVVGEDYVDDAMAKADEFTLPIQRMATAWAWGAAWGDDTIDRKTRSLMNLAMLTALNKTAELQVHVRGALNNGLSMEEIRAALIHATAYCGMPAGLQAFRAAHQVLKEEGKIP